MLELARQRLGETADPYVADLSKRLPFADDSFDDAVSSLILQGNHPTVSVVTQPDEDYFAIRQYSEE